MCKPCVDRGIDAYPPVTNRNRGVSSIAYYSERLNLSRVPDEHKAPNAAPNKRPKMNDLYPSGSCRASARPSFPWTNHPRKFVDEFVPHVFPKMAEAQKKATHIDVSGSGVVFGMPKRVAHSMAINDGSFFVQQSRRVLARARRTKKVLEPLPFER